MTAPLAALSAVAVLGATPPAARAQGFRLRGVTSVQYLDLRGLADDSVPVGETVGDGTYRQSAEGFVVRCIAGAAYCGFRRPAGRESTVPSFQDLQFAAWGLGTGVSVHAQLRLRQTFGSSPELYPRAVDKFDALAAYVEIDRTRFRGRLGRQWMTSSELGMNNFDGASLLVRPSRTAALELYGGWGLAAGLNEPLTSKEIAAVEDLPPDDRGLVFGGVAQLRPRPGAALSVQYQREIRTDRAALLSERVAADAALQLGRGGLDAAFAYDLATGFVNEARLRARLPERGGVSVSLEGRRYRPFFQLWTIWGAFSPVGYTEGRALASWQTPSGSLAATASGGWRRYDATDAGLESEPLRRDGWRVGTDVTWRVAPAWVAYGSYGAEVGFGASRSDGSGGVRWERADALFLGAHVTGFQRIYEFRLGTGRVIGGGVDAGVRLGPDVRLVADADVYRQRQTGAGPVPDWNQRRASVRLEWTVGTEPGLAAVARARR
jgi:hypothetical protein